MNLSKRSFMKTLLTTVLASCLCSIPALAGQPPSNTSARPGAPTLAPTPQAPDRIQNLKNEAVEIKKNHAIASVGNSGIAYRSAGDSIPPLVIQFSSTNQNV